MATPETSDALGSTAQGAGTGFSVGGPWGALIGGAVGLAGSFLGAGAADAEEEAARQAAATTLYNARQNQALNEQRYGQLRTTTTPYFQQEFEASQQLAREMGLPTYEGETPYDTIDEIRRQEEIANLTSSIYSKDPDGYWSLKPDKREDAKAQLRALNAEQAQYREQRQIPAEEEAAYINGDQPAEQAAYQQTPAYQRLLESELSAVNQGAANTGSLYSGSRGEALSEVGAGVETQFYTNYITMLERMANPTTTTAVGQTGVTQGLDMTAQQQQAQLAAAGYGVSAAQSTDTAEAAQQADFFSGLSELGSEYFGQGSNTGGTA